MRTPGSARLRCSAATRTRARRHYRQALEIEPEFAWVRWVLLPALEQEQRQD